MAECFGQNGKVGYFYSSLFPEEKLQQAFITRGLDFSVHLQDERRKQLEGFIPSGKQVVMAEQVHGNKVASVIASASNPHNIRTIAGVDALITRDEKVALLLIFADCVPLFIYDAKTPAIGLVHAGWKGIVQHICQRTLQQMQQTYGSQAQDLACYVGPSIGRRHFEVQEDVAQIFYDLGRKNCIYPEKKDGHSKYYVDLQGSIREELLAYGIKKSQFDVSMRDTFSEERLFFSHRRDQGHTGRMAGMMSLHRS